MENEEIDFIEQEFIEKKPDQAEVSSGSSRIAGGNTKVPRELLYSYWFFTFNNWTVDQRDRLIEILNHECKWYVFQEEVGKKTGTPHLQGNICLLHRQRASALWKWNKNISWRATKCVDAAVAYCTKYETRAGKIYNMGIKLPERIDIEEPYGWQLKVLDIVKEKPDKRSIHWFWEPEGGIGKTSLCKYLKVKHDITIIDGKSSDMFHAIAKRIEASKEVRTVVIDVPRCSQDYINYGAIEKIKNGLVFSGKYEGAELVFNCPHVIVFANEPPNIEKMSKDRWKVYYINKEAGHAEAFDNTTAL